MATDIVKVMARMRNIIEAITPNVEPNIKFRRAPMNGPLEHLPRHGPDDATRRFHVITGVLAESGGPQFSSMAGTGLLLSDTLAIKIRYHIPLRSGGYKRLSDMTSSDAYQIAHAVAVAYDTGITDDDECIADADLAGGATLTPITTEVLSEVGIDAWILIIPFNIRLFINS